MARVHIVLLLLSTLLAGSHSISPVEENPVFSEHHVIKHTHKVRCRNCYCGGTGYQEAKHHCPANREVVPCDSEFEKCYRCSCRRREVEKSVSLSPTPSITLSSKKSPSMTSTTSPSQKASSSMKPLKSAMPTTSIAMRSSVGPTLPPASVVPHPSRTPKARTQEPDHSSNPHHSHDPHHSHYLHQSEEPDASNSDIFPSEEPSFEIPSQSPKPVKAPSKLGCTPLTRRGGGRKTVFQHDLGAYSGRFGIMWQMDRVPDKLMIYYSGSLIFSTLTTVSGSGSAYLEFSGRKTKITIVVQAPVPGTGWTLQIGCAEAW